MKRRNFIKAILTGSLGAASAAITQKTQAGVEPGTDPKVPRIHHPGILRGEMLYRPLGSTGEQVSAIGLGGSHIGKPSLTPSDSIRLIHQAIERGITFLDNCWDYNEGQSEL